MNNHVTLFSNGIGHFCRVYEIGKGEEERISIAFNNHHIGDVAASLQVFGKVKLVSPPSFTPTNADATSLEIDQKNAMRSLVTNLAGAKVKLSGKDSVYTLVGLHSVPQVNDKGIQSLTDYVVLMSEEGWISKQGLDFMGNMSFVEPSVQAEVTKALKKNFGQIKPDSTFLELALKGTSDEEKVTAQVQYTIPVAAWKMRYAIRQEEGFNFEGAAIIDNNTDEDVRLVA